jgi:predicted MFS family arabinose efflux permease
VIETGRVRFGFAALLAGAMAFAMFPGAAIGILSRFMIDDLGLTRTEIGLIATGFFLVEALTSLPMGGVADRLGGRTVLFVVLTTSAIGMLAMATAWNVWTLLAFAAFAGIAPAGANPATNHLIIAHIAPGSRGWITGVKQSGVQVGIFAGGLGLPPLALTLGWRWALALSALVALSVAGIAAVVLPRTTRDARSSGGPTIRAALPTSVRWLAGYGILMGIGVAAYSTYLPLYSQEVIGLSVGRAGGVMAVFGVVGLVARITWGRIAEKASHPALPLLWIGVLSVLSAVLIWGAASQMPALLWLGAAVAGLGSVSWMSVGMMAIMTTLEPSRAGRGSAAVTLGFAIGLTIGPVAFGVARDVSGSYAAPLAGLAVVFGLATALMALWLRREAAGAKINPTRGVRIP